MTSQLVIDWSFSELYFYFFSSPDPKSEFFPVNQPIIKIWPNSGDKLLLKANIAILAASMIQI